MEVHHHSHTERSKWKHYFWEFFMLFLAVTLGFMVENRREHYIEHQRAKIYARAMFMNLRVDTSELKQIQRRGEFAIAYIDSFISILSRQSLEKIPTGQLYWYGSWGGYFRGFEPNNATFQQMKSSGSLRYFDDPDLEQAIGEYDQLTRSMQGLNEVDQEIFIEIRKLKARIFDFRYNYVLNNVIQRSVFGNFSQEAIDSFMTSNPPLLNNDRALLYEYAELTRSRNIRSQQRNIENALKVATLILQHLQEKFHLKD